jgi:hypothetical protein
MAANLAGKPMRDDDVATSSRANRDFSWNVWVSHGFPSEIRYRNRIRGGSLSETWMTQN